MEQTAAGKSLNGRQKTRGVNETSRRLRFYNIQRMPLHGDSPSGAFVHKVIEYLVRTDTIQIQITVYLEKMNLCYKNCMLVYVLHTASIEVHRVEGSKNL